MRGHHLAQFNVAIATEPLDHPALTDFMAELDAVNALADDAPGFVWRLQDVSGNSVGIRLDGAHERMLINLSVWEDVEALKSFTYSGGHRDVFRRRREWFEAATDRQLVMWWVPAGTLPDVAEGSRRLDHLRRHGPTQEAFTFATPFPPPHG